MGKKRGDIAISGVNAKQTFTSNSQLSSFAFKNNDFITNCAKEFGSQSVVVSIDCKKKLDKNIVFIENGKIDTGIDLTDWIRKVEVLGAGEILINSIDNDCAFIIHYAN